MDQDILDMAKPAHPNEHLFACYSNRVPDGSISGYVTTPDEARLRYARWEPKALPHKGTVIILHGRTEFIEKYFETIEDLRSRGFGVLTFDWRGQGGSSRLLRDSRRGHIENFEQYLIDLETIVQKVALPDCRAPFYVLAHSTGGLVALLAAPSLTNRVQRMVLVSPLLEVNNLPISQPSLARLLGFLTFMGLGTRYVSKRGGNIGNRPFASNRMTSDADRFQRTRDILATAPELGIGAPTVAWVFAACRAMATVNAPGYSNVITIPTLMIAAGNDAVVKPSAIENFGQHMRTGAFLTVSGAKHELIDERDVYREQFLAAFDAFVPGSEI